MEPMIIPPATANAQNNQASVASTGIDPVIWTCISILLIIGGFLVALIKGDAAAIGALMVGIGGLAFYFIPSVFAFSRKHPASTGIVLLNLFLGWTFLGWLGALIWAVSRPAEAPSPTTKACPACAETILLAAVKCKHCGTAV